MRLHIFIIIVILIRCLYGSDLENVYCNTNISSTLTSTGEDDFLFNLSSISIEFNNSDLIDVEFIISPLIPIEIYFMNTTIYHICTEKVCHLERMPTMKHFILRINRYLHSSRVINYTLSIECQLSYTTTRWYSTATIFDYKSTKHVYSVAFTQNLSFKNRANILCFGVSVFIVILFTFFGLIMHRKNSSREELQFIGKKSNYWFYVCSLLTLGCNIFMCFTTYYNNKLVLGILVVLNMSTINLVSVIGIKYYQGCIHNRTLKKFTLARIARVLTALIAILYAIVYYVYIHLNNQDASLIFISFILTCIELGVLSFMSFASKTAQIQWLLLFLLIWWIFDSEYEEIVFDYYWYSIFCIACAISTIFLFAPKQYSTDLRSDFINIFGSFLSVFDIATDIAVMTTWISNKYYFWVVMQLIFIFTGTIYSALYIDDYYLIADVYSNQLQSKSPMTKGKKKNIRKIKEKRYFWGRIFTLIGVGRVYHGVMGWDDNNKDMEIINRVLKVWEMVFESFPTIALQTWISLYTNLDVNIVLSLFVGFASISFTFFRILYGDHHSDNREDETVKIAKEVMYIHKPTKSLIPASISMVTQSEINQTQIINDPLTIEVQKSNGIEQRKSIRCLQSFICCIPFKLLYDFYVNYNKKEEKEDNSERTDLASKDEEHNEKLFYFMLYLWITIDSFLRIFPILMVAFLLYNPLHFLAIMFGLSLIEFVMYYRMLDIEFRTPRIAIKFFWTLYMTISYCLLSTMYLVYLPNNVILKRLIQEHTFRMSTQFVFIIITLWIQVDQHGGALGFFNKSIIICGCVLVIDVPLTWYIYRKMKNIQHKFKIHYSSLNVHHVTNYSNYSNYSNDIQDIQDIQEMELAFRDSS